MFLVVNGMAVARNTDSRLSKISAGRPSLMTAAGLWRNIRAYPNKISSAIQTGDRDLTLVSICLRHFLPGDVFGAQLNLHNHQDLNEIVVASPACWLLAAIGNERGIAYLMTISATKATEQEGRESAY